MIRTKNESESQTPVSQEEKIKLAKLKLVEADFGHVASIDHARICGSALCLLFGIGRNRVPDVSRSNQLFLRAADEGYAFAQYMMSIPDGERANQPLILASEQVDEKDYYFFDMNVPVGAVEQKKGWVIEWYRKAAAKGYAAAQYKLAICYEFGIIVQKDLNEAEKWYRSSAAKGYNPFSASQQVEEVVGLSVGDPSASVTTELPLQVVVTSEYKDQGKKEKPEKQQKTVSPQPSKKQAEKARGKKKAKSQKSQSQTKKIRETRQVEQTQDTQQPIASSTARSAKSEGVKFDEKKKPIERTSDHSMPDEEKIRKPLEAAQLIEVDQKDKASVDYSEGQKFMVGKGVERNIQTAFSFFLSAAKQGDAAAQNQVGLCYQRGDGVRQNFVEAERYYAMAAAQGFSGAAVNRDMISKLLALQGRSDELEYFQTLLSRVLQRDKEELKCLKHNVLHIFVECGHGAVVAILLRFGHYKRFIDRGDDVYGRIPLIIAAAHNDKEMMEMLFSAGANQDAQDSLGRTALFEAARAGHIEIVNMLLERKVDHSKKNLNGVTALFAAAVNGHQAVVEALLRAGVCPNVVNKEGKSALFAAAVNGHQAVAEVLLRFKADKDIPDGQGRTPLFAASVRGHRGIVEVLLRAGADKTKPDKDGRTPCFVASVNGYKDITVMLSDGETVSAKPEQSTQPKPKSRADIEYELGKTIKNSDGVSRDLTRAFAFFSSAAEKGHAAAKNELGLCYQYGIGVSKDLDQAKKYFRMAVALGDSDAQQNLERLLVLEEKLKSLVKQDHPARCQTPEELWKKIGQVDMSAVSWLEATIFHVAATSNNIDVLVALLGSEVGNSEKDKQDKEGVTPLFMAALCGSIEAVEILVYFGANKDIRNMDGETPLFIAAAHGNGYIVEVLLRAGADKEISDNCGRTPLMQAILSERRGVVEILLRAGVNLNKVDIGGRTALFMASWKGNIDLVRALLRAGADPNKADKEGKTPFAIAVERGNGEIAEILRSVTKVGGEIMPAMQRFGIYGQGRGDESPDLMAKKGSMP